MGLSGSEGGPCQSQVIMLTRSPIYPGSDLCWVIFLGYQRFVQPQHTPGWFSLAVSSSLPRLQHLLSCDIFKLCPPCLNQPIPPLHHSMHLGLREYNYLCHPIASGPQDQQGIHYIMRKALDVPDSHISQECISIPFSHYE